MPASPNYSSEGGHVAASKVLAVLGSAPVLRAVRAAAEADVAARQEARATVIRAEAGRIIVTDDGRAKEARKLVRPSGWEPESNFFWADHGPLTVSGLGGGCDLTNCSIVEQYADPRQAVSRWL